MIIQKDSLFENFVQAWFNQDEGYDDVTRLVTEYKNECIPESSQILKEEAKCLLKEADWEYLFDYFKENADGIELTNENLKRFLEIIIEGLE